MMAPRNSNPEFEDSGEDDDRDTLPVKHELLFDHANGSSPFSLDGYLRPGEVIGESYEIIDLIGEGGMGCVYRVRHKILQKTYAMKILSSEHITEKSWRRLQVEAQAIARMNHPNIVGIHNLGLHQGRLPYYVMDLLSGVNLAQRLKRNGSLLLSEAIPIFVEICNGVDFAHKKGIVHRDIKPANIILLDQPDASGAKVKVVDFGIAKLAGAADPANQNLTSRGEVFGSPCYMSPEQCEGGRIDTRSDVYSIGCTLFEALTGSPPFHGSNHIQTMMMHQSQVPPTLKSSAGGKGFPESLECLVAAMLAKAPMDRYQSLERVADDLMSINAGKEIDALPFKAFKASKSFNGKSGLRDRVQQSITFSGLGSTSKKIVVLSIIMFLLVVMAGSFYLFGFGNKVDTVAEQAKFSKLSEDGQTIQFEFPKDSSIGKIGPCDDLQSFRQAQSTVSFPARTRIAFIVDSAVFAERPQILDSFRVDDLYSLTIRPQFDIVSLKGAMKHISHLKSLRRLNIEGNSIDDSDIQHIGKLTNLETLNVNLTGITGSGISKMLFLRNISELFFNQNRSVYPMLKALEGSERLSMLYLEQPEPLLTERDAKIIASFKNLEVLGLCRSGADDKTLETLSKLKRLRSLDLRECSISKQVLAKFTALKRRVRLEVLEP